MSVFLQTMIARHQGQVATVQPRQTSMFEPETAEAGRPSASATGCAEAYPAVATLDRTAIAGIVDRINPALADPSPTAMQPVRQAQRTAESLYRPLPDEHRAAAFDLLPRPDNLSPVPANRHTNDFADRNSGLDATELPNLNDRIEEILDHLTPRSAVAAPKAHEAQDFRRISPAVPGGSEEAPLRTFLSDPPSERNAADKALPNIAIAPLPTLDAPRQQSGALQIPAWLQELQTSLGRHARDVNSKADVEPVINVTIGRIEIRATKTDAGPPAPKPGKPSGLLSLDDYLKQRSGRSQP